MDLKGEVLRTIEPLRAVRGPMCHTATVAIRSADGARAVDHAQQAHRRGSCGRVVSGAVVMNHACSICSSELRLHNQNIPVLLQGFPKPDPDA